MRAPWPGDLYKVTADIVVTVDTYHARAGRYVPRLTLIPAGSHALCIDGHDGTGALFTFLVDDQLRRLSYADLDRMTLLGSTHYPAPGTRLTAQGTCRLMPLSGSMGLVLEVDDLCDYVGQVSVGPNVTTHQVSVGDERYILSLSDQDFHSILSSSEVP